MRPDQSPIRPGESLGHYHDRMQAAKAALGPRPAPRTRTQDIADIQKAITDPRFTSFSPWANPGPTRVPSGETTALQQLGGPVPYRSPESRASGWVPEGAYDRQSQGVGAGQDVDFRGHSDFAAPAAARVEASGRGDPHLGQAAQRGQDFTQHPISPLPGRADWRGQQLPGVPVGKSLHQEISEWEPLARCSDPVVAAEAQARIKALLASPGRADPARPSGRPGTGSSSPNLDATITRLERTVKGLKRDLAGRSRGRVTKGGKVPRSIRVLPENEVKYG